MSTGIVINVILAIACVVVACVMLAAGARALRTTRRNELGLASNNEMEQAHHTFGTTAVVLIVTFLLALIAIPLMVKFGHNLALDPAEETSTPAATSEPAQDDK